MKEVAKFAPASGMAETYFAMTSRPGRDFRSELEELLTHYAKLAGDSVCVWKRFHLSDVANQASILRAVAGDSVPMVGQAPANGARVALEAWHLPAGTPVSGGAGCRTLTLKNYRQLFFHAPTLRSKGSAAQTEEEFSYAEALLAREGGSIPENLQRTWLYCRDIDNNYAGLVTARRERFRKLNLTERTHYIASTGIEGQPEPFHRLVRMDSFALFGHEPGQVRYLAALDHLSPTHIYGVTFERATRICYGDRSHYYLSGTASIDKDGNILHAGDVVGQTRRLLENTEALLAEGGGTLADLKQAVIYLRDPADQDAVERVLDSRLSPDTARIIVRGSVCRPGWLVEMDGIAVNGSGDPRYKEFI